MEAAWCLLVVPLTLVLCGVPVRWLLGRGAELDREGWIDAPFVGLAVLVLVLQNLVYCNIPIRVALPPLGLALLVLYVVLLFRANFRASWRRVPRVLLAGATLVLLVVGWGYLQVGPTHYIGRGWSDSFNYVAWAEMLNEIPFNSSAEEVGNRPYLHNPLKLRSDRIGQSVLNGCLALLGGGCKEEFVPTILACAWLLVLAVYSCGRGLGLGHRPALVAGVFAGLLPNVTMLQLECFLSHALGLPLLLYLPAALARFDRSGGLAGLGVSALVLAALVSVYTEFLPLGELLVLGFLALRLLGPRRSWRAGLGYAAIASAPVLLNPAFAPIIWSQFLTTGRLTDAVLLHIYPWAGKSEGVARIWFGDLLVADFARRLRPTLLAAGLVATGAGVLGLVARAVPLLVRRGRGSPSDPALPAAFPLSLIGLLAVPVFLGVINGHLAYQRYKLVITVCPLLVLGLVWNANGLASAARRRFPQVSWLPRLPWLVLGVVFFGSVYGTVHMIQTSIRAPWAPPCGGNWMTRPDHRHFSHSLVKPGSRELAEFLPGFAGRSIVYRGHDGMMDLWIAYLGRHNRLWMTNPLTMIGTNILHAQAGGIIADLDRIPSDVLFLGPAESNYLRPVSCGKEPVLLWSSPTYCLWVPSSQDWVCLTNLLRPDDSDDPEGRWFWIDEVGTRLVVLAARPGSASLRVRFPSRPGVPATAQVDLHVGDYSRTTLLGKGENLLRFPVRAGVNRVTLRAPLGHKDKGPPPEGPLFEVLSLTPEAD